MNHAKRNPHWTGPAVSFERTVGNTTCAVVASWNPQGWACIEFSTTADFAGGVSHSVDGAITLSPDDALALGAALLPPVTLAEEFRASPIGQLFDFNESHTRQQLVFRVPKEPGESWRDVATRSGWLPPESLGVQRAEAMRELLKQLPNSGDVSLAEQLRSAIEDAAKYRDLDQAVSPMRSLMADRASRPGPLREALLAHGWLPPERLEEIARHFEDFDERINVGDRLREEFKS